ncbi:hypothetical protein V5097_02570 [Arenibacter palladensis]|uniref:hypothetical protein n=1 Tax=Arenibacter palladensis TaxID=237373 RepID=UPI002FD5337E
MKQDLYAADNYVQLLPFQVELNKQLTNSILKKITLIIIAVLWISSLLILIISLTNLYPENVFKDYRSIVGISFIAITGFLKTVYNTVIKENK